MTKENKNAEHIIIQLKTIRECKDISQAELSKLCNTKQEVISRMENGKHSPSLSTVCKIANNLGYELILRKENN